MLEGMLSLLQFLAWWGVGGGEWKKVCVWDGSGCWEMLGKCWGDQVGAGAERVGNREYPRDEGDSAWLFRAFRPGGAWRGRAKILGGFRLWKPASLLRFWVGPLFASFRSLLPRPPPEPLRHDGGQCPHSPRGIALHCDWKNIGASPYPAWDVPHPGLLVRRGLVVVVCVPLPPLRQRGCFPPGRPGGDARLAERHLQLDSRVRLQPPFKLCVSSAPSPRSSGPSFLFYFFFNPQVPR